MLTADGVSINLRENKMGTGAAAAKRSQLKTPQRCNRKKVQAKAKEVTPKFIAALTGLRLSQKLILSIPSNKSIQIRGAKTDSM